MSGYLPQKTAMLPAIELEEPVSAIGKSTVQAMQVGAVYRIPRIGQGNHLLRIRGELSGLPVTVATGGDAELIARGLPEIDRVDPDLTLDGLRQVAARVFPQVP